MLRPFDKRLLGRLDALRRREHNACVDILLELVEVERRKLHVELGYPSMFAFVTRHLRYSESAAGRRVRVARCMRDHPEVIPLLRRGVVNLSTLSLVSRVLDQTNKNVLLERVAGRSQREVEAIVAAYEPAQRVRDRIRPVSAARTADDACTAAAPLLVQTSEEQKVGSPRSNQVGRHGEPHNGHAGQEDSVGGRCNSSASATGESSNGRVGAVDAADRADTTSAAARGANETRFRVQFAASAEFMRKFEEARTLLSGRLPAGVSIEAVFEAGLDAFLDRRSPARRNARRNARRKARDEQRATRAMRDSGRRSTEDASACEAGSVSEGAEGQSGRAHPQRESSADRPVECLVRQPTKPSAMAATRDRPALAGTSRRTAVPAALRDAIFERDGGACTFVASDGRRCASRYDVEIDHCQPVARGGTHSMDNLRLLCPVHNRLEAERVFGAVWMQQFAKPESEKSPARP